MRNFLHSTAPRNPFGIQIIFFFLSPFKSQTYERLPLFSINDSLPLLYYDFVSLRWTSSNCRAAVSTSCCYSLRFSIPLSHCLLHWISQEVIDIFEGVRDEQALRMAANLGFKGPLQRQVMYAPRASNPMQRTGTGIWGAQTHTRIQIYPHSFHRGKFLKCHYMRLRCQVVVCNICLCHKGMCQSTRADTINSNSTWWNMNPVKQKIRLHKIILWTSYKYESCATDCICLVILSNLLRYPSILIFWKSPKMFCDPLFFFYILTFKEIT